MEGTRGHDVSLLLEKGWKRFSIAAEHSPYILIIKRWMALTKKSPSFVDRTQTTGVDPVSTSHGGRAQSVGMLVKTLQEITACDSRPTLRVTRDVHTPAHFSIFLAKPTQCFMTCFCGQKAEPSPVCNYFLKVLDSNNCHATIPIMESKMAKA
ncbi:hypothetical protein BDP81DRAFT_452066 [Colletotrichum phormii]|uniref:Uncharacterized protein n=1 Tax=Colletotrichum phormii TaxID=359342 RepID=A0AAI9ZNJ0_9PEZI|nr:uncharacterized protein BDP81DRAFT_452066 [Colletotrichum phormii]KAK1634158.1 hypothetical protein BDP81DRAFT_452066 [Colletotrichum phormii]